MSERYAPRRSFPPYAYLPGRDPHPVSDPRGHSYSSEPPRQAAYFAPERWRDNDDYLFGVDLYNAGFLWEAHEVWEGLWHSAKHDALQADFLQGLIQCAAACLKIPMQQPAGVRKLSDLGLARLERVAQRSRGDFMGLDVHAFTAALRAFVDAAPQSIEARPRLELER